MQVTKETPVRQFIIQDQTFSVPAPFVSGHVCTESEAGVLNQTLAENVRNNMAQRVKKAVEEGTFNQDEMQLEIDQYIEDYEFGLRRGRGPIDPTEREALNIAKDAVKDALRRSGYKLADVDAATINDLAAQAVDENPEIRKEAERRVKERNKVGALKLDLSAIKTGEAAEAGEAA